jgi:hypothetical protein
VEDTFSAPQPNRGKPRCADQWHDPCWRKLRDGALEDRDIRVAVQARRINDAVGHRLVFVECKRPRSRKALTRRFRHVSWHPHPDCVIVTQVDKAEFCNRLDLSVAPRKDFFFLNRKVVDETVATITQDCFEETDLERLTQIENAKPLRRVASARITEPARRLSKSQRIWKGTRVDPAKATTWRNVFDIERETLETGRRLNTGHLAKVTSGKALSCSDHIAVLATLQGVQRGPTVKSAVWGNKEAVNRPGTRQDLMQFWECRIWAPVLIELPCREPEPPFGAVQAEHLAVLTLGVDRDP